MRKEAISTDGLFGKLTLVHPSSEDFDVYGGADTVARAREWAIGNHYLLARDPLACAHGFYMLPQCPRNTCGRFDFRDHVNLWVPTSGDRPFLLAHPYNFNNDEAQLYAKAHGLDMASYPSDGWYSKKTTPIRMGLPANWPLWPIEAAAIVLLQACPVEWA